MANVAPGDLAGIAWWVDAVVYPSAPSTSVPIYKQAESDPSAVGGPFGTKLEAEQWANGSGLFGPGKTNIAPPVDTPVTSGIPGASSNPLTGLASIGDAFSKLSNPNFWLRVAEFGIAGILLFAGINHLLGNPAGRAVRDTVKGAAIIK